MRQVTGANTTSSYEHYCYDAAASPTRGNLTTLVRLASGSPGAGFADCANRTAASNAVAAQYVYDAWGNVVVAQDGRGVSSQMAYDGNNLYVTTKREACNLSLTAGSPCTLAEVRSTGYITDPNSGQRTSVTDMDNTQSTTFVYDDFGRPLSVTDPADGITSTSYPADASEPRFVKTLVKLDSSRWLASATCFDTIGHATGADLAAVQLGGQTNIARTSPLTRISARVWPALRP